jgi:predicted HTH domain antitoxin
MTVNIPDELLKDTGLTERDVLIELACRLFDVEKLALWQAAKVAGLSRGELKEELAKRKIALYRPTPEDLVKELAAMDRLGI